MPPPRCISLPLLPPWPPPRPAEWKRWLPSPPSPPPPLCLPQRLDPTTAFLLAASPFPFSLRASGRSTRTLLPPPWAVSSSRALLVVSHPPPTPVAAAHAKVDHSGRFCSPRSAREFALLCEGSELLDRIPARGGKYSEEDAKVVMLQIFSVVSFCHLQGVVHRDLNPENFLFTSKDETFALKVIDFGLSDFVKPDERLNDIVGSVYYVAPEVLHRSYGNEADMWSIGVIAYILLCGSRPFWARTESGIFRAVLKAEPSFDEAPWPTLTAEAKDFVKMLLNKDYRKRMTAAQALSYDICGDPANDPPPSIEQQQQEEEGEPQGPHFCEMCSGRLGD